MNGNEASPVSAGVPTDAPANTAVETVSIEMRQFSDHKAVVRYKAVDAAGNNDSTALVTDVYVSKKSFNPMPREITLTVTAR